MKSAFEVSIFTLSLRLKMNKIENLKREIFVKIVFELELILFKEIH